jgi:hypothetical protein
MLAGGGGIVQNRHHYELDGVYCVDNLAQFRDRLVALNS